MTETILRRRLMEFGVPLHAHDGLVLYLMHGLRPGHFLMAVLENDLLEAVIRADDENVVALHRYVKFLFNVAPSVAWGSPGEVAEWITSHRKAREVEVQQEGA